MAKKSAEDGAGRRDASKPEAGRPDASNAEASRPDASKPADGGPDASEPGLTLAQTRRQRRAAKKSARRAGKVKLANPQWFVPVMIGLFVVGLAWIVVFYLSQQLYPIPEIGVWNLVIGFGILMSGFLMSTRWK